MGGLPEMVRAKKYIQLTLDGKYARQNDSK
jgi:hypothetical protein